MGPFDSVCACRSLSHKAQGQGTPDCVMLLLLAWLAGHKSAALHAQLVGLRASLALELPVQLHHMHVYIIGLHKRQAALSPCAAASQHSRHSPTPAQRPPTLTACAQWTSQCVGPGSSATCSRHRKERGLVCYTLSDTASNTHGVGKLSSMLQYVCHLARAAADACCCVLTNSTTTRQHGICGNQCHAYDEAYCFHVTHRACWCPLSCAAAGNSITPTSDCMPCCPCQQSGWRLLASCALRRPQQAEPTGHLAASTKHAARGSRGSNKGARSHMTGTLPDNSPHQSRRFVSGDL